jgi:histidinol-phosphatase (PHP family)
MLTDYHTHSWRCGHATGTMREYVEAAIRAGIGEIGLTDHLYLYFLPLSERNPEWAMPEEQYDEHYREMLALRDEYRDRINVRVAIEADYAEGHEDELLAILARYEFDYVLGSVHYMDGWMIDAPENAGRYREEVVADIFRRYFRRLQQAMRLGAFDLIAHFDLPKKFGLLPEEDLTAVVGETLDVAADTGVALEISTAGLRKPVGEIYPSPVIVREMAKRQIPVSLSSDAHAPAEVGHGYDRSIALLRECGYREIATFQRRRRTMVQF